MSKEPQRHGAVIYLREDKVEEYEKLHSKVWEGVRGRLTASNIRNFTIYYCKPLGVLFSHFEYTGENLEEDMKAIGDDPITKEWWKVCHICTLS